MTKISVYKVALTWLMKTAKNLPPDVERYVQEGKDSGMDESKAWAIAWSRYCKYKNPGSDHCQMDPSEYFPGRKSASPVYDRYPSLGKPRGWKRPKEIETCPEATVREKKQKFIRSIDPIVADTSASLKKLGYRLLSEPHYEDADFESEGKFLVYFEVSTEGYGESLCLEFSGDFEDEEVFFSKQFDVDEIEEWSDIVSCPPEKFSVAKFTNLVNKEFLVRGRVTSDILEAAIEKVGFASV